MATQEATAKVGEGKTMPSQGQEAEEEKTKEGGTDPRIVSTQMKCQHPAERVGSRKKVKASKLCIDLITLTEGDLHDISKTVHNVTNEALQDFMQENQIALGALRV